MSLETFEDLVLVPLEILRPQPNHDTVEDSQGDIVCREPFGMCFSRVTLSLPMGLNSAQLTVVPDSVLAEANLPELLGTNLAHRKHDIVRNSRNCLQGVANDHFPCENCRSHAIAH